MAAAGTAKRAAPTTVALRATPESLDPGDVRRQQRADRRADRGADAGDDLGEEQQADRAALDRGDVGPGLSRRRRGHASVTASRAARTAAASSRTPAWIPASEHRP